METIDLRSDTLTLPTEDMLAAMTTAELGDDGRSHGSKGEDPTVVRLEEAAALKFGKEDAIFVPSGTMGNALALLASARRGDLIVVDKDAHIFRSERANFDRDYHGFTPLFVLEHDGIYDLDFLEEVLRDNHVSVVCLENSHNFAGGTVLRAEQVEAVTTLCGRRNVPVHVDGARIFNAAAATGQSVQQLTAGANSVMFCLSKGLCAPVGSMLVGSKELVALAREKRKLLGGQMRQAGVLAAAGIIALEKMTNRVAEDNVLARQLAEKLSTSARGLNIDLTTVQTNIVKIDLGIHMDASEFARQLYRDYKVRVHPMGKRVIRLVVYHGIGEADIDEAVTRISMFVANDGSCSTTE